MYEKPTAAGEKVQRPGIHIEDYLLYTGNYVFVVQTARFQYHGKLRLFHNFGLFAYILRAGWDFETAKD
jgi:hypothetical protein